MFTFMRNYSIKRKLLSIMLIATSVVLLLVSLAFFVNSTISFRSMIVEDQRILANIVGSNTAAALTFNDQQAANETLESITSNPHIIAVAVINSNNMLFAAYIRKGIDPKHYGLGSLTDGKRISAADLYAFEARQTPLWANNSNIKTVTPFLADNKQLSTIMIVSDTGELRAEIFRTGTLLGIILIGALILSYFISSKLQRVITEPVLHLADTMARVSLEKNYTVRAEHTVNDEIGDLVNGLNEMLAQIEQRDGQLKQHRAELEEKVAARTSELSSAKIELEQTVEDLRETTKTAESASLAKSQFLANMSHEIRTPMHGVLGMTELLLESNLTSEQRHFADTVHNSALAMLDIINDILDFSKIEAGKLELQKAPLSISAAITNVAVLFNSTACKKGLKLTCTVDAELPDSLIGDVGRLRQIITNLVNNAIKFTDQGEVLITAAVKDRCQENITLLVEVKDSGIGIKHESQKDIFDRFSQADGGMNRKFGGTGLGLTIARELVELMDGEIGVTSEPGKGSTFWFTVQLPETGKEQHYFANCARNCLKPAASAAHNSDNSSKPLTVLVAEDNQINQDLIKTALRMMNYNVDLVWNGQEAIDAWLQKEYGLILMDGQMPHMDGFEATRRIRALEQAAPRSRTNIIAMTGQAMKGDKEIFLEAGMDDYLPKPFTINQVRELMNQWLPTTSDTA